jgi:hypothetical protein
MKFNVICHRSVLTAMMCLSSGAWANEVESTGLEPVADTSVAARPSADDSSWGGAISMSELEHFRGGFDVVKNDMQLSGTVANNSTYNVVSGNNLITGGSFSNASGFPTVVQNSGSNVLIQNATIINLQYE